MVHALKAYPLSSLLFLLEPSDDSVVEVEDPAKVKSLWAKEDSPTQRKR